MSRLATRFEKLKSQQRKALVSYVMAGDPQPQVTVPLLHKMVAAGVDVIELGLPFSDPMADGPVIQRASERALTHKVSLKKVLAMVAEFRLTDSITPIILMGYANPIEAMGVENFTKFAKTAGVDGVLTVDYPPEECVAFIASLKASDIDSIFLLSPTSDSERTDLIVNQASGFLYYVSLKGVTGAANLDVDEVRSRVAAIRAKTALPIGVGFGVKDAVTAKKVAAFADAVVVGSRMVQTIEQSSEDNLMLNVSQLMEELRKAIDSH